MNVDVTNTNGDPTGASKIFNTATNVADEREYYTFHQPVTAGGTWTVVWRVRALRTVYGALNNALPSVTYGPWSPAYVNHNGPITSGTFDGLDTLGEPAVPGHDPAEGAYPRCWVRSVRRPPSSSPGTPASSGLRICTACTSSLTRTASTRCSKGRSSAALPTRRARRARSPCRRTRSSSSSSSFPGTPIPRRRSRLRSRHPTGCSRRFPSTTVPSTSARRSRRPRSLRRSSAPRLPRRARPGLLRRAPGRLRP